MLLNPFRSRIISGPVALVLAICVYMTTTVRISKTLTLHKSLQLEERAPEPTTAKSSKTLTLYKSQQLKERAPEPIDICFVSSIFAPTIKTADRPNAITNFKMGNTTSFQFFMYTNLEDLESPGWTKVLRHFTYRRFITQSRWGKFMAWKDPEMEACQTIFYLDGHFKPGKRNSARFAGLVKQIRESEFGLAQKLPKITTSAIGEFDNILRSKKDIMKNVNASIDWLQAQPDFYNNCTVYHNCYFGKSITYVLLIIRC
jgi:hypothetical protein